MAALKLSLCTRYTPCDAAKPLSTTDALESLQDFTLPDVCAKTVMYFGTSIDSGAP